MRKNLTGTLQLFIKREIKYLQPYYYQDGAWHKQEELSKPKRVKAKRK